MLSRLVSIFERRVWNEFIESGGATLKCWTLVYFMFFKEIHQSYTQVWIVEVLV